MNEQPRQKLREIIARHGRAIVQDERRCTGLLRDYSGEFRREVSVLVSALEEHVPNDLLAASSNTPRRVLLAGLARRLADNRALSEQAAVWSVNSWAFALDLISDNELKTLEGAAENAGLGGGNLPDAKDADVRVNKTGRTDAKQTSARVATDAAASVIVSASGDGDHASINEALKHVLPGGQILLRPGVYEESIILDKSINIVGDGGARHEIVIKSASASCLKSSAKAARVAGLTIRAVAGQSSGEAFFAVDVLSGEFVIEDCDISSETMSCLAVHGPETVSLIKGCRIHDGADSGLYFFDGSTATVEDCEVYRTTNVGVAITGDAQVVIKRSRIHGGSQAGMVVWQSATGLLEECEIYGNRMANIVASERAKLTARVCRIREGKNSGIFVHLEAEAVLEGCELYGHLEAEAAVTTQGRLFLNDCRIHDGHNSGVLIRNQGQALLQACVVSNNAGGFPLRLRRA